MKSFLMQSLQSAIEGYTLGLSSSQEGVIGPLPVSASMKREEYTAWASAFPTPAYDINEFYTGSVPSLEAQCLPSTYPRLSEATSIFK